MTILNGQTLANRYRIEESLGRGGMAEVYQAWDTQRAACLALKVLRQDMARGQIFLRRFQREAQTLEKVLGYLPVGFAFGVRRKKPRFQLSTRCYCP